MDLNEVLKDLNIEQHMVLCVCAVANERINERIVARIIRSRYSKPLISITPARISDHLKQLHVKKLLVKSSLQDFEVKNEYHLPLLRYYKNQAYFDKIVKEIQLDMPTNTWYWAYRKDHNSNERLKRDLILYLLTAQLSEFNQAMHWYLNHSEDDEMIDIVPRLFAEPDFQEDFLKSFDSEFQQFVVINLLRERLFELESLDEYIDFGVSLVKNRTDNKEYRILLGELVAALFCTGKILTPEFSIISRYVSGTPLLTYLAQADLKALRAALSARVGESGKGKSKNNIKILGFPMDLVYLFSLASSDEIPLLQIQQYSEKMNEADYEKSPHYYSMCMALSAYFQGQVQEAKQHINNSSTADHPITLMLSTLIQAWLFPDQLNLSLTEQYVKLAKISGYDLLAFHLRDALSYVSNLAVEEGVTESKLVQESAYQSILDKLKTYEPWELTLAALSAVAEKSGSLKGSDQNTRIAWFVDFENLIFTPKLQKIKKNGGWSKGRNVSQERMLDGDAENITKQDIQVARILYGTFNRYSNTYKVSRKAVESDSEQSEKLLRTMVNHPYLFLDKSGTPCALTYGDLQLLVQPNAEGKFEMSLSLPMSDISSTGLRLVRETPTRYKIVEVTDLLLQLSKIVSDKVEIPATAEGRLTGYLKHIKQQVDVKSPLTENIDEMAVVPYENRIHVHLLPVADGFHVELFIKPVTGVDLYFKPGKGGTLAFGETEKGEKVRTQRNLENEKKSEINIVEQVDVLNRIKPVNEVWELEDAEICLELLLGLEELKTEDKIVVEWPKGEKLRISHVASWDKFRMNASHVGNWFEINGELKLDESLVFNMQELMRKMNESRNGFIEIGNGEFMALTQQFKEQLLSIERFTNAGKDGLRLHPLAAGMLDDFAAQMAHFETDLAWKEQLSKMKEVNKQVFEIPEAFNGELRDYQKDGYLWLRRLAYWNVGGCLADDMGLGKTIQMLALLQSRSPGGPSLVIAPASVCRNWKREAEKFTPDLVPVFYNEEGREHVLQAVAPGQIIIATYGLMQQDIEEFEKVEFETIVLDEAQAIKNYSAKRTKAALRLNGKSRFVTTGTPIENHLGELWTLFEFINPGLLGSAEQFQRKFAGPIERYKDEEAREILRRLIQPFVLRRRKSEVLKELPEKTEIQLDVEMSQEEMAFYEALRRQALEKLQNSDAQSGHKHLQILAEIMRMRQACCHPKLVSKTTAIASSKLSALSELLDELIENDHKVLIFSQFVRYLKIIENYISDKGISYQYLDGSTPIGKRQDRIDAFQAGKGDVFLISLKAGGTGLNLTAADYVIHMDPWWNPAVEDQASDRAHRIGQTRPVTVYRLVTRNTIEDKIISLHEHKRDLANSLLSGSDMSGKLSAKELMNLIQEG